MASRRLLQKAASLAPIQTPPVSPPSLPGITMMPAHKLLVTPTLQRGRVPGMLKMGNIDLYRRPNVRNPDGSISTVRSLSFNVDGREILVPTVSDDGRIMSDEEAINNYFKTKRHLGIFQSPQHATSYADILHKDYEAGNIFGYRRR